MTKGDKIVILIILILSISLFFIINFINLNYENKYISIQINGEETEKIDFTKIKNTEIYPIESKYGKNVLEVKNEKIRVIEASCPDKLDVKQGYIEDIGDIIVCIPNRLVIEIKGDKNSSDIDAFVR